MEMGLTRHDLNVSVGACTQPFIDCPDFVGGRGLNLGSGSTTWH